MPSVPEALRADLRLPPISDIRSDSLNCAVVNSDAKSLNRLIAHYNHEEVLNKVDGNGSTPIHVATMHKDADMVDLLLSYEKIDLNILQPKIIGGYAALHIACNVKEPRIISSLLNAGANPNIKSNSIIGETPLQICCKLGYVAGAKLLISAGQLINSFTTALYLFKLYIVCSKYDVRYCCSKRYFLNFFALFYFRRFDRITRQFW